MRCATADSRIVVQSVGCLTGTLSEIRNDNLKVTVSEKLAGHGTPGASDSNLMLLIVPIGGGITPLVLASIAF